MNMEQPTEKEAVGMEQQEPDERQRLIRDHLSLLESGRKLKYEGRMYHLLPGRLTPETIRIADDGGAIIERFPVGRLAEEGWELVPE